MYRAETVRSSRSAIRAPRREPARLSTKETNVAISDKRLVEMIKEFEADPLRRNWPTLKAALFARRGTAVLVPREMRDRIEASERQNPELFARARRFSSN
jgi:hypothetical protein